MRLFESNEKNFNTLGICSLNQCLSCTITEELNGSYELVMTYHMDSKGFKELKHRRIIYAKPNPYSLEQPFRIYAISTPINRVVTVNASHISYDLSGYVVEPFSSTSIYEIVNSIKVKALVEVPFSFYVSGDLDPGEINLKTPESVRSIIGNHILKVHKPEIEYNQNEVYFRQRRGSNNGVVIRYGKNLLDISHDEDCINVYTDVYPFWQGSKYDVKSEDGSKKEILVTLTNKLLKVNESFKFTNILILDLSSNFKEEPTEEQLKKATEKYIKEHKIGEPTVSITVDFMQLTSSEEYHKYRLLDKVMLGDDVTIEFNEANIYATSRCIKTTYSPKLNKYTEIELGETTSRLTDRIANDIQKTQERTDEVSEKQKIYFEKTIVDLTNGITGNSGGYVILNPPIQPQEILVMDAPKKEDAVIVWRWNKDGLGVSTTGYNGPFQGIGVNGKLVINEVTAYKMTASMLEGGILSGIDGELTMSLQDDYFQLSHPDVNTTTKIDSSGFFILDNAGEPIASLAGKDTWSHMIVDTIQAHNIQNIYLGDANLYVDHSKTEVGTGSIDDPFSSFYELKMYLESTPIIDKDVTVNIVSTGTIYDTLDLRGLTGKGNLTINIDKNLTISNNDLSNQAMLFINCLKYISINGGRTGYNSDDGALFNKFRYGIFFINCLFGEVTRLAIDTNNSGGDFFGIIFRRTNGRTEIIDYVDSRIGLYADGCSTIYDDSSCGNCISAFQSCNGSTIMYGDKNYGSYRPTGSLDEVSGKIFAIDDGATAKSSIRKPPAIPSTRDYTQTFNATGFGTYQYAWSNWATGEWGNRAIQGVWDAYGNKSGHIFFNVSSIRSFISTGTVKSASITLTRRNGGGYSSATNIYLNCSSVSSASGTPSYSNHTHIGSLSWGEQKTFTVPNSIILNIKNGTSNSLACYSSTYSDAYVEIVAATLTIKVEK